MNNCNSSNNNSGDWNSGNWNSGNCNGGSCNSGNYNSGNYNGGSCNSGNYNGGNYNSGDWNSGNNNSGNYNSGCWNSGNYNIDDHNIGNHNIGNYNAGDWNKTLNAVGCFNTEKPKLKFFDKETDMTLEQWLDSGARYLMDQIDFRLTDWIYSSDMTDEEKAEHPEHETTGGYLKIREKTECCTEWWNGLSEKEKNIIKEIPNFDADKFYQITGIRV